MTPDVNTAQPATSPSPATANASAASSGAATSAMSSDFETFLKMLTVQMKNQDPLNPIESSDYAVQLATFSGVEQQVQTNDLLKSLASQMGVMGMAQISGWVGMEARSNAPVQFDGDPITLAPAPRSSADQSFLIVKDAAGNVVQTSEVPATSEYIEWDGMKDDGTQFAAGTYSFSMENFASDEFVSATSVDTYGEIIEARAEGVATVLVLKGGVEVNADDVSALRAPK